MKRNGKPNYERMSVVLVRQSESGFVGHGTHRHADGVERDLVEWFVERGDAKSGRPDNSMPCPIEGH
jgi:hypothetical protein